MARSTPAKKDDTQTAPTPKPVRSKSVIAGDCPRNAAHENVSVYKTQGRTRYCKCNDCGATWKVIADAADTAGQLSEEDRTFLRKLADGLEAAPRSTVKENGRPVEVIQSHAGEADAAAKELRRIAG